MSGVRPATPHEVERLWPSLRAARLFESADGLDAFYRAGPWRVLRSERGDVAVVERWREHLPVLALKAVWAPDERMGVLLDGVRAIAAAHGFEKVISPLVAERAQPPYAGAGFAELERIVALQSGAPSTCADRCGAPTVHLRLGMAGDLDQVLAVDNAAFPAFWAFGLFELERAAARERLVVAECEHGIIGYTLSTVSRGAGTLGRIAVDPPERRQGVGAALLGDALRWAGRAGALTVALCTQESNATSRALYARAGFEEVSETYAILVAATDG